MDLVIDIAVLLAGFILLIKGAGWLVDGASALAGKFHVKELVIGLTIVAFGTSAPELVVSVLASADGHQDIALSNVLGSNIFNLFVILGISGLIHPLKVQSGTVGKEIPFSLLAAAVLLFLYNDPLNPGHSRLSTFDGVILLGMFLIFLFYIYSQLRRENLQNEENTNEMSGIRMWILIIIGLTGLVVGGKLVVSNATSLAGYFGMSEKMIGLTVVAAGTSLPELATSVAAAIKKKMDIAVGNIIGSNIFNLLLILGISCVIEPIQFVITYNFDILFVIGGTAFLLIAMFTGRKNILDRWESGLLLILYIGYILYYVAF